MLTLRTAVCLMGDDHCIHACHVRLALTSGVRTTGMVHRVADDLGWNDVGWHAGSDCKTPHLDALAATGLQLDQMYVQHICSPTRSALMSGKYPIHTGLSHGVIRPTSPYGLPLSEVTLAQEMRAAGYATHAVGKWHLGFYAPPYLPTNRGFDSYFGYLLGAEDYYYHNRSYGGVGGYDLRSDTSPVTDAGGRYSAHLFTDMAQGIVQAHAHAHRVATRPQQLSQQPDADSVTPTATDASQPLFLYLPYQSVHDPAQAPESYIAPYRGKSKPVGRAVKCGMVAALDEGVANVTATLKASGMWNDTLFIVRTVFEYCGRMLSSRAAGATGLAWLGLAADYCAARAFNRLRMTGRAAVCAGLTVTLPSPCPARLSLPCIRRLGALHNRALY